MAQVRLVQKTDTGKIYAMKTLKKEEMLKKDQVSRVAYDEASSYGTDDLGSSRMSARSATC